MSCAITLYVGNNNVIGLQGLTNLLTGVADTGATVQVTLKDMGGNEVSGQVWPATMAYGTDADGVAGYYATLEDDLAITDRVPYVAHIDAVGSSSEVGHWEIPVTAKTRRS